MTRHRATSKLEKEIDANLKRAFDAVVEQEVPDRFVHLLEQLRAAEPTAARKERADND